MNVSKMQNNSTKRNNIGKVIGEEILLEAVTEGVFAVGEEVVEGGADSIGDVVSGLFDGADDLPSLAVVGIIAGIVAAIGGIICGVSKLVRVLRR